MAMYGAVKGEVRSLAGKRRKANGQKPGKELIMSTHAAIGMRLPDNTIQAIYCHNDGYPGGAGAVLGGWYTTPERVKALIDLGSLSQVNQELAPAPGTQHSFKKPQELVTIAYHRDRNDRLEPGENYATLEDYEAGAPETFGADYLYLFENGKWSFYSVYGEKEWTELEVTVCGRN